LTAGLVCIGASGGGVVILGATGASAPLPPRAVDGTITVDLDHAVSTFDGRTALGAGVDGLEHGEINKVWTRKNLAAMRSAGFGPISYRLRTELGVKAWHWNSAGTFSAGDRGYWVSAASVNRATDPGVSYGYRLPRRGNTIDQATNDGYSRVDDGDLSTYWKSNPYLDSHFTGEPDARHPQWMMVDLGEALPVDTVRIAWGDPYATQFRVQYWTGNDAIFPIQAGVTWRDFPMSTFGGSGGTQTVRVATAPLQVQFIRVLMTADSNTAVPGSRDIRDRLGYAVRELSVGFTDEDGFTDQMDHKPSQDQTTVFTSSTDPWHRATDIDRHYEHASFERVYASGITNGLPMMVPVPVLYGVPEDAAALVRYLRSRGFGVNRIEMGEEPDGQLAQPEDYGELYRQMASAIHAVDPAVQTGGPGYQTTIPDWVAWPDAQGVRSWTGRFVSYLRQRGALGFFDFFSFEWYPFDDVCSDAATPLARHPAMLADILRRQETAGLPKNIPKVITEYGYSSYATQKEVELPGAIVDVESVAQFFALGGETTYFYGLEPNWVFQEHEGERCDTWGNLMLFQFFDDWQIRPVAAYHAMRLLTQEWAQPGGGAHSVFAAAGDLRDDKQRPLVTAYAVRRPDGRLSVLVLNKDPHRSLSVRLVTSTGGRARALVGDLDVYQYSGKQFVWHFEPGLRGHGYPKRNEPPEHYTEDAGGGAVVTLPPYSITVVRTHDRY
jgi:hypothetical protein